MRFLITESTYAQAIREAHLSVPALLTEFPVDKSRDLCTKCAGGTSPADEESRNSGTLTPAQSASNWSACRRCLKPAYALAENPTRLLTPEQTADRLALSKRTVYTLMKRGELHSVTVGRARRIPSTSLDEFISGLGRAAS